MYTEQNSYALEHTMTIKYVNAFLCPPTKLMIRLFLGLYLFMESIIQLAVHQFTFPAFHLSIPLRPYPTIPMLSTFNPSIHLWAHPFFDFLILYPFIPSQRARKGKKKILKYCTHMSLAQTLEFKCTQ